MSNRDRERWESKHAEPRSAPPGESPGWITAAGATGIALDIAAGQGRHTRLLADAGLDVVAVDISRNALGRISAAGNIRWGTQGRGRVMPIQADLDHWPFGHSVFDVVIQVDFLSRALFPEIRLAVRPGGFVLVDTFRRGESARGRGLAPSNPEFLLRPGELDREFDGWEVILRSITDEPAPREAMLVRRPL